MKPKALSSIPAAVRPVGRFEASQEEVVLRVAARSNAFGFG